MNAFFYEIIEWFTHSYQKYPHLFQEEKSLNIISYINPIFPTILQNRPLILRCLFISMK